MAREESGGPIRDWLQKPAPGEQRNSMGPRLTRFGWLSMFLPLLALLVVVGVRLFGV